MGAGGGGTSMTPRVKTATKGAQMHRKGRAREAVASGCECRRATATIGSIAARRQTLRHACASQCLPTARFCKIPPQTDSASAATVRCARRRARLCVLTSESATRGASGAFGRRCFTSHPHQDSSPAARLGPSAGITPRPSAGALTCGSPRNRTVSFFSPFPRHVPHGYPSSFAPLQQGHRLHAG